MLALQFLFLMTDQKINIVFIVNPHFCQYCQLWGVLEEYFIEREGLIEKGTLISKKKVVGQFTTEYS